jgi:CHAT domain-containing protein
MGDRLLLPRLLAQLADVRLSRGRVADAAMLLEEADDIVEGMITRASSPWVRSRIIAGWDDVLITRIRLEGERSRGDPARVFSVLERARGRSLLELLNSNSIANGNRPAEWRTGERKIATLQLQLLRTTDRAARQRLLDQIFVAEEQLAPISTEVFAAANSSARKQVSLAQVRAALRPDELLLEYVLAEPSSFTVAVTRTDSRLLKLPGRSVIEAQIQSLVRAIQDGHLATDEARTLGTTLVGAVPNIARFTRLIVSADGMTHTVPFEMLVSRSGALLLETHVVSYVPSASTLVALRAPARRASPTQMALAIGASPDVAPGTTASATTIGSVTRGLYDVDAEQLRPLPSAGNEARAVVAAFPGRPSTVLVGNAATEQAVKSQPLASFRLMHFAAHGPVAVPKLWSGVLASGDAAIAVAPATTSQR